MTTFGVSETQRLNIHLMPRMTNTEIPQMTRRVSKVKWESGSLLNATSLGRKKRGRRVKEGRKKGERREEEGREKGGRRRQKETPLATHSIYTQYTYPDTATQTTE